jgi:hypothetical protein
VLVAVKELIGWQVAGVDKQCGRLKDVYFHDQSWSVEHWVVWLGKGKTARGVVIPCSSINRLDPGNRTIHLSLTREEVESAPTVHQILPVCRQYELRFNHPLVQGYSCVAEKSDVGTLADLLLDSETWRVPYLRVHFSAEKRTVQFHLQSNAVERLSWATRKVYLKHFEPVQVHDESLLVLPAAEEIQAEFG